MIPFTISASLSAWKIIFPSTSSACSHTRLWQPSIRFCSVLYFSSSGSCSFPKSIRSWYRSIQSSKSLNSAITSSCTSLILIMEFTIYDLLFDCLFLILDDFEQCLSHCVESALVDDVHGVVYRVPEVTEAGVAVRVIVDDVYAGNLPQVVYIHMVVCHFGAFFFGEEVAEAQAVGCVPYLVHVLTGG